MASLPPQLCSQSLGALIVSIFEGSVKERRSGTSGWASGQRGIWEAFHEHGGVKERRHQGGANWGVGGCLTDRKEQCFGVRLALGGLA